MPPNWKRRVRGSPTVTLLSLWAAPLPAQDTLVVHADRPPKWGTEIEAVEELRIGVLEGPEEEMFGRVGGVAVTPDGVIWVVDASVPVIRRFDGDGSFLGSVGRSGEGPGEYLMPLGIKPTPDGGVAVWDPRNSRISLFGPDAGFRTSLRHPGTFYAADVFQVDTAGYLYVRTNLAIPRGPGLDPPQGWVRLSPEGAVRDTVSTPPPDQIGGGFVLSTPQGFLRPFTVETMSAMSPHGYLVTARNSEYAFTRPLSDGRILKVVRSHEPVPLALRERAQWQAIASSMAELARGQGRAAEMGPIPTVKPPFHRIWADGEGRVWVSRYVEAEHRPRSEEARRGDRPVLEWREPPVFDVFTPGGEFLGRVRLPHRTRVMAARGTHIWAIQAGEFDEPYVVRYRLESG